MANFDIVIVGSGAAGLYCALKLSDRFRVLIVTKKKLTDSNTCLAQGGMTTILNESDKSLWIEDTLRAGRQENDLAAVTLLGDRAGGLLSELRSLGVPFTEENGELAYIKENAHSRARIVRAGDETGRHLTEILIKHVSARANITILENTVLLDILEYTRDKQKACAGVLLNRDGKIKKIKCQKTVLASGGVGGLFRNTTNHATITGDAIAIAYHHGITIRDLNRMQFHPTALYEGDRSERRFLITEAIRGEGARLLNPANLYFVDPLDPRDEVIRAIRTQMRFYNSPYVYLDISHRERSFILDRFPMIYEKCLSAGYEITFGPFPVSPAQHFFMGGIAVDLKGKTSMAHLYAIGETSCTGVHGANRLAGNSLLEALVYGGEAAEDMNQSGVLPDDSLEPLPRRFVIYEHLRNELYKENLLKTLLVGEDAVLYDELFER